ncbi:MAG: PKD domain-containing protein [Bacteroidota bacterium]
MHFERLFARLVLCFAFCWACAHAGLNAQPVAAFTSNITQGCAPVEVQFSDQSTSNPTNWFWDFGDGTTSTLKNPLKVFSAVGTFTVSLTVSNALGSNIITRSNLVTAKPVPIAQFSASPTQGCFPMTVNFADLSSANGAGTITAWNWNFGDGTPNANIQNPTHTYTDFGDFDVALYVENASGCAAYLNKPAFIKTGDTVKADFDTTMLPYCKLPKTVSFLNVTAGSGTFTYSWDFGDGTGSNQANPVHNYTTFGKFTVKLIATSSYGCSNVITKVNHVVVDTVLTDFSFPAQVCINSPVLFNNLSAPVSVNSSWNFGDGTGSTVFRPSKQYSAPGTYGVVLTNRFANGCVDSIRKNLIIATNPAVAFSNSAPISACKAPLTVSFTDNTPGAALQQWDFGDGGTATGAVVSHTYNSPGSFTVKLVVSLSGGCKDSLSKQGLIRIAPPDASIAVDAPGGCVPFALLPRANVTSVDPVTAYNWDFGDGFTSVAATPSHTYTLVGVYTLRLIITTAGGCKDTAFQTIRVGTQPVIGFTVAPSPVCARKPVFFTDTSSLGSAIFWDFGDGNTSSSKNAIHRYDQPGVYNIIMRVDNGGCTRDTVLNNYLQVLPPSGDFSFAQDCTSKFRFSFNASASVGANTYNWNFGDGATATGINATHTYTASGNFTVSLFTNNGNCTDTFTKQIAAGISSTSFRVNTTSACRNVPITFAARYETPAYVSSYSWDFGDGATLTVSDSVVQHAYAASGTYTVRLVVVNVFGCVDTVVRQNFVVVNGPTAAFTVVNPVGCTGKTVTFTDNSTTDGTHAINNWKWDFGDGSIQSFTAPPFTHVYASDASYNVKLVVTDNIGCKDSVTVVDAVKNSRPAISFATEDTVSCPLAPVILIANGQGNNLVYTWNTGVGTLTNDTAIAAYPDSGRYTVKLYVTDGNGCVDSVVKVNYISIKKPVAAFTLSDSASICPPLKVRFANGSYYYNRHVWDFDNGTTSFQQNPYVAFQTGSYNVKLRVTAPGGCMDSVIKTVKVYPYTNLFTYQPLTGCQPLAVTFRLSVPTKGTYKWDFNDGTTANTTDSFVVKKYTAFGPYLPRVFFTETSTGCILPVNGDSVINVFGTKVNFGMSDSVFCETGTVNFSDSSIATGPMTYRWIFGDGNTSTLQNPTHTYAAPGRYTVQQIVSSGACSDTMTKTNAVIIYPKPRILIMGDSVGCQPFRTIFTPRLLQQDSAAISWNWDFGNGQVSTLQNPPQQLYTAAGTFVVRLRTTASTGCTADTSKQIIVNPLPAINAGNDTTVCVNVPVTLRPSGATNYTWLPPTSSQLSCTNCPNPVATLASPSEWYYVQGTTQFGCTATDSIHVQYLPAYTVTAAPVSDSLCLGQTVQLTATGAKRYLWTPATGLSSTTIANPVAAPAVSTTYRLVATDTLGCQTFTQDIPISVFPYPTVNAGPDVTISGGASTVLNATASADATRFNWTPASQLSCTDCLSPTATPRATTNYVLTVTNGGECPASDTVTVTVLCNNTNVFIPNTFSPNGDGMNDVFYPRGTGLYSIKSFRIFSRWGEMVFGKTNMTPNDISQGWDGKYKGSRAATDVYTYIAEIYCDNNTLLTLNGTINLIY